MNDLTIRFEWEDPGKSRGEALRRTWARLTIEAGDECVTRVHDHQNQGVRDGIFLPLFPLAEWLVANWWFLAHESNPRGYSHSSGYSRRHDLFHAREGYALPHFSMFPFGQFVRLDWKSCRLPSSRVTFTQSGTTFVDRDRFTEEWARLIEAVISRTEECPEGGELAEAWSSVQSADAEEAEFCSTAAAMGLDPYSLPDALSREICDAAELLPSSIRQEFFSAVDPRCLREETADTLKEIDMATRSPHLAADVGMLRKAVERTAATRFPWTQGYEMAKSLRAETGAGDKPLPDRDTLLETLGLPQATGNPLRTLDTAPFLQAVATSDGAGGTGFYIRSSRDAGWNFGFCRALGESLDADFADAAIITSARTARQQRNRAFAAEFLAPASRIKTIIGDRPLQDDLIIDLAETFGVSEMVIQHQVENHALGVLATY